jgi:hypothetical protein
MERAGGIYEYKKANAKKKPPAPPVSLGENIKEERGGFPK